MKKYLGIIVGLLLPIQLLAFSYSTGDIYLGEWNAGFTKGKSYAEATHLPMLLLWARKSCPMCELMKKAIDGADFQEWTQTHRIIMSVCHDGDADSQSALGFIRSGNPGLGDLPLLCVYWPKADGTVVKSSFVGREGTMLVKTGTLAMRLAGSVESILADFDFASTTNAEAAPKPETVPMPAFALSRQTTEGVQYFPVSERFELANVTGGAIQLKRASGKLPSGMKLFYDAAAGNVRLEGTSNKAGTYTSNWRVNESRASGLVKGTQEFTLTLNIVPVSSVTSAFAAKSSTLKTSGLVMADDGGLKGVVSLTLSQKGVVKLQYEEAGQKKVNATSKSWTGITEDRVLETSGSGKGVSFALAVEPSGLLYGTWTGSDGVERTIKFSQTIWSDVTPASAFAMSRKLEFSDGVGELQLVMQASAARNGIMSFKGTLPDQIRLNGKSVLIAEVDGVTAWLPILKKSGRNQVTGLLFLNAQTQAVSGAISFGQAGAMKTVTIR